VATVIDTWLGPLRRRGRGRPGAAVAIVAVGEHPQVVTLGRGQPERDSQGIEHFW
jgi:hypothetical protein